MPRTGRTIKLRRPNMERSDCKRSAAVPGSTAVCYNWLHSTLLTVIGLSEKFSASAFLFWKSIHQ